MVVLPVAVPLGLRSALNQWAEQNKLRWDGFSGYIGVVQLERRVQVVRSGHAHCLHDPIQAILLSSVGNKIFWAKSLTVYCVTLYQQFSFIVFLTCGILN